MDMVRKGRVSWIAKGDFVGQAKFISKLFAAYSHRQQHISVLADFRNETL